MEIILTLLLRTPAILVDLLRAKTPKELVVMILIFKNVWENFVTHIKVFLFANVLRTLAESRQ